jgi:hypothetical protein
MTRSPESYPGRPIVANQILLPSAARTVTGTGEAVLTMEGFSSLTFQLDLTSAATESGDTLDVFVQTPADGTNWIDIVHFTQALGNGGAKRFIAKIVADAALTEFEAGTALGAAASRAIFGDQYRVRWAITDSGTANASFTFSVVAVGT